MRRRVHLSDSDAVRRDFVPVSTVITIYETIRASAQTGGGRFSTHHLTPVETRKHPKSDLLTVVLVDGNVSGGNEYPSVESFHRMRRMSVGVMTAKLHKCVLGIDDNGTTRSPRLP